MKDKPISRIHRGAGNAPPLTTMEALFVEGSDQEFRRFIYRLLTMSVRINRLRERIGRLIGLNGFRYHIVMNAAELDSRRPVSVNVVAEILHSSGIYMTMETGKLQRAGLIEKLPNPGDGRGVLLPLTPKGLRTVEAMSERLRVINDVLFDGFDIDDLGAFNAVVTRMLETIPAALSVAERAEPVSDPRNQ